MDGTSGVDNDWLTGLLRARDVSACVIEVFQDAGQCDYRFLAVSPGFERSTALGNVVGRSMRELRPEHEQYWFDLYRAVAETGEPACFEHSASALERRYRGHAFRIGGPDSNQVAVVFAVTLDTGEAGLERFGAMLAHELRSPLASMGNGLHALKRKLGQDADGQKTVLMMERQIARLSSLIGDMLDIGRLGSTDVHLQFSTVDLHHVISESIEACGAEADARRHEVTISSDGAALRVRADVRRLVQVFSNLLSNSIKYTAPGGHIRFRLKREDGLAMVEVCDDGIGINAEDLPRVFDLYTQGSMPATSTGSLGIGLSIVRSIVRLHGGSVEAHSDGAQKGSTFVVRLPLSA
jgi:signal transduction histidine kinase